MFRALVTPPQLKQDGDNAESGSNDVADAASPLSTPVPTKAKKLPPVPKKRDGTVRQYQCLTNSGSFRDQLLINSSIIRHRSARPLRKNRAVKPAIMKGFVSF